MFNQVTYNVNFLLSDFLLSTSKSLHSCFSKLLVGKKVTRKYVRKYFLRYLLVIQKCIGNHKNYLALLAYSLQPAGHSQFCFGKVFASPLDMLITCQDYYQFLKIVAIHQLQHQLSSLHFLQNIRSGQVPNSRPSVHYFDK